MEIQFQLDLICRLLAAAVLGSLIGFEREIMNRAAGLKTHVLTSVGSALFTILSLYAFDHTDFPRDPARVAAQIVSGIGFLGAGTIMKQGANIKGLTTASTLWAVAAIGMGCGVGAYVLSASACLVMLGALILLSRLENRRIGRKAAVLKITIPKENAEEKIESIYKETAAVSTSILKFEIDTENQDVTVSAVFFTGKNTDASQILPKLNKLGISNIYIRL